MVQNIIPGLCLIVWIDYTDFAVPDKGHVITPIDDTQVST